MRKQWAEAPYCGIWHIEVSQLIIASITVIIATTTMTTISVIIIDLGIYQTENMDIWLL